MKLSEPLNLDQLFELAVPDMYSDKSRYRYRAVLKEFFGWLRSTNTPLDRKGVRAWLGLKKATWSPATVAQALSAVKLMCKEAVEVDAMPYRTGRQIVDIRLPGRSSSRRGHTWLTKEQFTSLLNHVIWSTTANYLTKKEKAKGKRDVMLLALLGGAALRRTEASHLKAEQLQSFGSPGGRAIVNLEGKFHKYRTVPLPSYLNVLISDYQIHCGVHDGYLLRTLFDANGKALPQEKPLHDVSIEKIVIKWCSKMGWPHIRPHDLRRTWAKLALEKGTKLEQIMTILGHKDLVSTQKYLGIELENTDKAGAEINVEMAQQR